MAAPVTNGLTTCVAQRHVACADWMHLGTKHLHALHVGMLTLHIGSPHEHLALHIHQRTHRRRCHTVLSGSRLCDNPRLPHLLCQQDLSDGVVDLVGSRVVQVLALQVQLAAVLPTHPLRKVQRTGPSHIVLQQRVILLLELLALNNRQISLLQVLHALVEYLRYISTSELSIESFLVNLIIHDLFIITLFRHFIKI